MRATKRNNVEEPVIWSIVNNCSAGEPCSPGQGRRGRPASWRGISFFAVNALGLCLLAGCHQDMYDQPRIEPQEASDFFDDGRAERPLVPGTVAYQSESATGALATGRDGEQLVTELPLPLDAALLRRGQERFNIYCSLCHGRTGDGDGMIVQRGYRKPPTFHSDRLRGAPIGHLFDVATNGFGAMPSYAVQVPVHDRWAIAAYIRALQFSQHAVAAELPEELRKAISAQPNGEFEAERRAAEEESP